MRARLGEVGLLSDDSRKILVSEEGGREHRVSNPLSKALLHYRVDGALIVAGQRCDYAVGVPCDGALYLVELKGTDLRHAASQIASTLDALAHKLDGYIVNGRIVLARVPRPDVRASAVIALEKRLARSGGSLRKASAVMAEEV